MISEQTFTQLQAEVDRLRAGAAELTRSADALENAIRICRQPFPFPATVALPVAEEPPTPAPAPLPAPVGARPPRKKRQAAIPPAGKATVPPGASIRYADAIVTYLRKFDLRTQEGFSIRKHVAKQFEQDVDDPKFKADVNNAMTRLREKGQITRRGTLWTLVHDAVA